MHEIVPVLVAIGVLLTVVTLVGHGIWLLLAALFGSGRDPADPTKIKCIRCGRQTSIASPRCDWCEALIRPSVEGADLDAFERQLRRFRESGTLDPTEVEHLLAKVRDYRCQLQAPRPSETASKAPTPEIVAARVVEEPVVRRPVVTQPVRPVTPPSRPAEHLAAKLVQTDREAVAPAAKEVRPEDAAPKAPQNRVVRPVVVVKPPTSPPSEPERNWTELLAGFLEERNIRWAELVGVLVGGLLIVGASLALVVSFWDTLQETYFKFWIFVGYSSAVFGAGLFAFHRWKLASTGRGLLVIATLLVPLNFVAMASLSPGEWSWQTAATEVLSLAIFAWLVTLASDVLVGSRCWPLTLAVLGNSAVVLLATRLFGQNTTEASMLMANCVPAALLIAAVVGQSRDWSKRRIQVGDAGARFTLLGVATFAGAVAIGILMTRAGKSFDARTALYCLAPSLALAAWPILASGLRIMRGMAKAGAEMAEPAKKEISAAAQEPDESLEAFRTAGTVVGLVGILLQLVALGLCWPQPLGLLTVGLLNAAGLVFVAFRYRFPLAHAGAMLCLALAYLAGFHLLTDEGLRTLQGGALVIRDAHLDATMLGLVFSSRSASSLCGLFLVFGAMATWFVSRGWNRHATAYVLGCGVTAVVAVLSVTSLTLVGSYADALHAAMIYAFYGLACVLISMRWHRTTFSYVGWNLLAAAPFWTLHTPLFATAASTAALAGCLFWLTAVWLLLARLHQNRNLVPALQCVLTAAVLVLTTSWLQTRAWVAILPEDLLFDPRSLQTYGIALALLSLMWIGVRILLTRVYQGTVSKFQLLCSPDGPTVDHAVRHLIVWLQTALVVVYVMVDIQRELWSDVIHAEFGNPFATAGGPTAWLLLCVLAVVWIAAMWDRWGIAELVGSFLLAATAPCLLAGAFADSVAVASALRWGLAACFIVCSIGIWRRESLLALCRQAKTNVFIGAEGPRIARASLLAVSAGPVVGLTAVAALLQLGSVTPGGPVVGSFFDRLGPNLSYLVPLTLVILGLVGHALREYSAGYAFTAGMVAEMAVVLGYALSVVMDPDPTRRFDTPEYVTLIQLATITAALWGMAWLAVRKWVDIWREESHTEASLFSRTLMDTQLGIGYLGNGVLLLVGLFILTMFHPDLAAWPITAGMPLGWIALALAAAAGTYRNVQNGDRMSLDAIGVMGMAVVGLVACTVRGWTLSDGSPIDPNWAYRVLMLGWSGYAVLMTLVAWWAAGDNRSATVQRWREETELAAERWVSVAGLAAVALALKAAFWHDGIEERLWAATAITLASVAGAVMAVYRRREGWALAAALGVNLAASLVVWYVEETRNLNFEQWWIRLVQANAIASATVALLWTAVRRWLFESQERSPNNSPCLILQLTIPTAANAMLLLMSTLWLVQRIAYLPSWTSDVAGVWGWLALLLTALAVAWYLWQAAPERMPHVLACTLLGAGVLAACGVPHLHSPRFADWLEYHILTATWASAAIGMLGIGFLGRNLREFPPARVSRWVTLIGSIVIALALVHAPADRLGAWWSIRAIGAMGVAAGIVALWRRSPLHVYLSGLSAVAIGFVAWLAWGNPHDVQQLIHIGVICMAAASAVWTVLQFVVPLGVPHWDLDRRNVVFSHLAAAVALVAIVGFASLGLVLDLLSMPHAAVTQLAWIALASVAASIGLTLWERSARLTLCGLYIAGLTALVMLWDCWTVQPTPIMLYWRAATELTAFVLLAAVIGWLLRRTKDFWPLCLIYSEPNRWPIGWFVGIQGALTALSSALVVWVSIDFAFDGAGRNLMLFDLCGRLAGAAGALMLLATTVIMARQLSDVLHRYSWQCAAWMAGLLLCGCTGWAILNPATDPSVAAAPWLHRTVVLLVAGAVMLVVSAVGLARILPSASDWIAIGRRASLWFGGLTLAALALVLMQEIVPFDFENGTPMASWAIAVVTATLALLIAACIRLAVSRQPDPCGLSESGRQIYVYAAEVLLALVGLHVRLTLPWLFHRGFVERYWMLIVMAVAFAGAGLSEFFHRRRLPVLSKPLERTALLLPLLPAVGFWFAPDPASAWAIIGRTPMLWFLMSAFYGSMAFMRRSAGCAALAVLVANMGLWVALHRFGIGLQQHPQLWLIPIALAVLVAEFLNHNRLSAAQSAAFRYLALSVIYLSSTADMFIAGLGKDWRLPLILMLLSVAGVLAGLVLRIRSFLLLGIVFLLLDIVAMIWHAAVDLQHTWIWYVCAIIVGVGVLGVVALFEKRRNDLVEAVRKLKQWER
jgi:hypothetical protein